MNKAADCLSAYPLHHAYMHSLAVVLSAAKQANIETCSLNIRCGCKEAMVPLMRCAGVRLQPGKGSEERYCGAQPDPELTGVERA